MINALKIKSIMVEKGFTQKSFAKELGMTRQNFAILLKKGDTTISNLEKIAKILDVELQILLK